MAAGFIRRYGLEDQPGLAGPPEGDRYGREARLISCIRTTWGGTRSSKAEGLEGLGWWFNCQGGRGPVSC
jgi:hypothetical protein